MADVDIFIRVNDIGPSDPALVIDFEVNGTSVATYPKSIIPTAYSDSSLNHVENTFDTKLTLNDNGSGSSYSGFVLYRLHGIQVKLCEYTVETAPFAIECTFSKLIGGIPNIEPTYLEELAKLDQYSKAQYVPDRR